MCPTASTCIFFSHSPNTYYARQKPSGVKENNPAITTEVNLMMDPAATPPEGYEAPHQLWRKRCNGFNLEKIYWMPIHARNADVVLPFAQQNQTGKLLSPRKVMMDTRDRLEEHGKHKDSKAEDTADAKTLHDYISAEELWACTTCNACTEACPVEINPVEIIVGMRQYKSDGRSHSAN